MPSSLTPAQRRGLQREIGAANPNTLTGGYGNWLPGLPMNPLEDALPWPLSVSVYSRMIRSDSQVAATTKALTYPIRALPWRVDPAQASEQVARFVADDLGLPLVGEDPRSVPRTRDRFSWADHLRVALLHLWFGHMIFEQVGRMGDDGFMHLRKLAPRYPATIAAINVAADGGLESIEQHSPAIGRKGPVIGVDRLVVYVNDREGADWSGGSLLRPTYKDWLIKDRLSAIHAVTLERNGMGVPVVEQYDPNVSAEARAYAQEVASAYRAGEESGAVMPFGMRMRLLGVEGSTPDVLGGIRYYDEQIARNLLTQFLQLGSSGPYGSRALSESQVDFFQLSVSAVAGSMADTATMHIVEDLVDWNFGPDEPAPRVVVEQPSARLAAETVAAVVSLIEVGAITPDGPLETFLRESQQIPARDPDAPPPVYTAPLANPAVEVQAAVERSPEAAPVRTASGDTRILAAAGDVPARARRQPTKIEAAAHVDFAALDATIDTAILSAVGELRTARTDYAAQAVAWLAVAQSLTEAAQLQMTPVPLPVLAAEYQAVWAESAGQAAAELAGQGAVIDVDGVAEQALPATESAGIERAAAVSFLLADQIRTSALGRAMVAGAAVETYDPAVVSEAVAEHLYALTDAALSDLAQGALTAAQGSGRTVVFASEPDLRWYGSSLRDPQVCGPCLADDGREFASLDAVFEVYPNGAGHARCQGGSRCRCTAVAVRYENAPEA